MTLPTIWHVKGEHWPPKSLVWVTLNILASDATNDVMGEGAAMGRLYRRDTFASDRDRVEHLFGRYEALVDPLGREG